MAPTAFTSDWPFPDVVQGDSAKRGGFARGLRRLVQPRILIAASITFLLVSIAAFAALPILRPTPTIPSGRMAAAAASALAIDANGILDSDGDDIPDAVENFVYGTDPSNWSTSQSGIPDGWLLEHGLDPLDPSVGSRPGAKPPLDALPPAYGHVWPEQFTPSLLRLYSHGRPPDWKESESGTYRGGLSPVDWDANDDTIPDGWLLAYSLDPRDPHIGTQRLVGDQHLTVLEAFRNNVNPRDADTDDDGLSDADEIAGPLNPRYPVGPQRFVPSNPRLASTTMSGICDGYLVAHGLDPSLPENAYSDVARSGVTNLEKFEWSKTRFGSETCTAGRGLDPSRQSTLNGKIPDGWFLRYKLDPLDSTLPTKSTQTSDASPGLPAAAPELPPLEQVALTVLDEYHYGRPPMWNETEHGPWLNGTNPTLTDTDADGIDDASEIRGYYSRWSTDKGPNPVERYAPTASDPTSADSDADGLADREEVITHHTDPSRRDTDADGIIDGEEVSDEFGLDAALADTPGDFLRDGERLNMLKTRAEQYADDLAYEYPGEPGVARSVADWMVLVDGAADLPRPLSADTVASLVAPSGDLDGDGIANILDPDIDDDGLLNGWELEPALFRHSQFGEGRIRRSATDPLNPDTDGDQLADGWETLHGLPAFALNPPRYTMDPSRWDSDDDNVGDGAEDPDADSFERLVFELVGSVIEVSEEDYGFPNVLEQQFETDPNAFDSDEDGLGDGWKAFWGVTYAPIPPDAARPILGTPQADVVVSSHAYRRFVLDPLAALPNEAVLQIHSGIPLPDGGARTVYELDGTHAWGFGDIHASGTNPYLDDTSLDTVPDWWTVLHGRVLPGRPDTQGRCVEPNLEPLVGYTDEDADADGLSVGQEFEHGSDPACGDTDLDGISDGEEVHLALDPADPSDGRRLLDGTADTDGDGVFDFRELVGVRLDHLGSGLVRTDPDAPDTDGDGVLDGPRLPSQGHLDAGNRWARLFIDLGISYSTTSEGGDRLFAFRGEQNEDTDPRLSDDTGTSVPVGWLLSHNLAVASGASFAEPYEIGRPPWWDEVHHGPWWGGIPPDQDPSEAFADPDLDNDGLDDVDGQAGFEDPMPFANRLNVIRTIDWNAYPTGLGLADPGPQAHPADESLAPLVRRLLAQAFVNPRTVGPSFIQAQQGGNPPQQQQPCIDVDGLRTAAGSPVTSITKGTSVNLVGRVHNCSGQGFRGVTVEARAGNPPHVFGAGFTDASGAFAFPVDVAVDHTVAIPPSQGAVLRGRTAGTVEWTADPGVLAPGANRFLTVRSYASPDVAPYTSIRPALASAVTSIGTAIRATSILSLDAPQTITTGSPFTVEFTLTDSAGSPLTDSVRLSWGGVEHGPFTPAPNGQGTAVLTASHQEAGTKTLVARSIPTGTFVTPAEQTVQITLRRPVDIIITSKPAAADAGETMVAKGRVVFQGRGVGQVPVVVNLTLGNALLSSVSSTTASDGTFTAALAVAQTAAKGTYSIVATALQTTSTVKVETTEIVPVRSIPRFLAVTSGALRQGEDAHIQGILAEPDGTGVPDAKVLVKVGDETSEIFTDSAGRFSIDLAPALPARPVLQELQFEGDGEHAAAVHRVERAVVAMTELMVATGVVPRGAPASVQGTLADASGEGVVGALLKITWGAEPAVTVLTGPDGRFAWQRVGNISDSLGSVTIRVVYEGSRDGGLEGSSALAAWDIIAGVELVLPQGAFDAGTAIPPGIVRDAGTKSPLPGLTVRVALDGVTKELRTDDEGGFAIVPKTNETSPPRRHTIRADFPSQPPYQPASSESVVSVRALTRTLAEVPKTITLGEPAVLTVQVQDLGGRPVPRGTLIGQVDGLQLGFVPIQNGTGASSFTVPAEEGPGQREILWEFLPSDDYAGSMARTPVRVVDRVVLEATVQPAAPGDTTTIVVKATRAKGPAAATPIFLEIQGVEGGINGVTDDAGIAVFHVVQTENVTYAAVRYGGDPDFLAAHETVALQPLAPASVTEKATRSLAWIGLVAAAVLAGLGSALYRLRRSPLEPLVRRLRRILAARGPDAQQILLAYDALEEAAIGFGILGDVAVTPRSLQSAMRPSLPDSCDGPLDTLMSLFEQARYSTESITPQHRDDAIDALTTILKALRSMSAFEWRPGQAASVGVET